MLGTLSGYSDKSLLEACEKGEDSALERYRDALDEALPDNIRMLIERQYEGVKRNHAQVRSLRDQAAWRRINRRLPIARWAQATVDHGVLRADGRRRRVRGADRHPVRRAHRYRVDQ